MKVKIELSPKAPADFQIYRVKWSVVQPGLYMLSIDFSNRVEPAGCQYDEDNNPGLMFDFQGTDKDAATIWLQPETEEEKGLIEYGQMNKRTFNAFLLARDRHLDLKFQTLHSEQEKGI